MLVILDRKSISREDATSQRKFHYISRCGLCAVALKIVEYRIER